MPRILTVSRRTLLAAALLAVAGCGLKGDLFLPEPNAGEEAAEAPAPADVPADREREDDDG